MFKHRLPHDWSVSTLELHGEVQTGLAKGKNNQSDVVQRPYLRVANVQDGYFDLAEIKLIEVEQKAVHRYSLRVGDVLLTEGGDFDKLGRGAVWRGEIPECLHQNHVFAVRPNRATLLPEFLAYQTGSPYGKHYFQACSKQSTNLASINSTQLKQFPLLLPPLSEQRRIADALGLWDNAVQKTERLIELVERRLSWIRAELLTGKRRLPGFRSEWIECRLADVLTEHGLKSVGHEEVFSVSVHKGLVNQIDHLGRSFAAKNTGHYNRVKPGDIVYTKSPTGDFPLGIIKQSKVEKEVIVSPLYGVFTPASPAVGVMLDAFFESSINTRNYLAPLVQKGAKNTIAITNKRFLEGRVRVPTDPAEQQTLAGLVTDAKLEVDLLREQALIMERQKLGLTQKLLTGEWRFSNRDPDVTLVHRANVEAAQ